MAPPLAAALAVLVALSASAQDAPLDARAFKTRMTQDFAKGTDLAALDGAGQSEAAVKLLEQAKYVQAGREQGDEQETHITFVRSVARRLGVNPELAVEFYGTRVRPPRAVAAMKKELDARAAIVADVKQNPGISAKKKARMAKDMSATSEFLKMGLRGDANLVADGGTKERPVELNVKVIPIAVKTYGGGSGGGTPDWSTLPPQVQRPYFVATTPPPPLGIASSVAQSWESLTSYFDWEKGKQVAAEAFNGTLTYVKSMGKMCYRFVKQALIDAGVIDAPNPSSTAVIGLRPGAAAMFSQDVKKNPKILDKMGYRQVDLAHVSDDPASVPDGSMLIYAGGCSFADAQYGHAEITVSEGTYTEMRSENPKLRVIATDPNEIRVCHFSCTKRSMPFLRTYGKKGCLKMYVPVKSS